MKYEVEQKHRVADPVGLQQQLAERGARLGPPRLQADEYFAHPARDFAATDEALRIRTVDGASVVTYKGPKIDANSKTRRELELPLAVTAAEFGELLAALGFRSVLVVQKNRREFELAFQGARVHGAWDEVAGVGTFVELELPADDASLATAQKSVAGLAEELQLGPSVRQSYLEMVLASRA